MSIRERCVTAYRKHQHLKLAGDEVGIPWQSVYLHLRKAGEPVVGNKLRYGSSRDRLAVLAEFRFAELVPWAVSMNDKRYQAKFDFLVDGHRVEVKASRLQLSNKQTSRKRYSFSLKKQQHLADFFVCFFIGGKMSESALLIPGEIARNYQTISISESGGKWLDYAVSESDLAPFFRELEPRNQEDI